MAIDNTPPRLKLIATIAVMTVITLIGINFVTEGYYAMMTDEAQREKLAPTLDRNEQKKAEAVAFTSAVMPIDKAMAEIGKGTRPDLITPQPSEDLGPMTGWSKLPKPAPVPQPHATPTLAADAGAELAGDAGVTPTSTGDAGTAVPTVTGDAGAPHAAVSVDAGARTAAAATDAGAHAAPAPAPQH